MEPLFGARICLVNFPYGFFEHALQVFYGGWAMSFKVASCNLECHWRGAHFLYSPHSKIDLTDRQYPAILLRGDNFPICPSRLR